MKKLNFISGIITKLLGTLLVISGLLFVNTVAQGNALQLNAVELFDAIGVTNIIILTGIEILALYFIIVGTKGLVDSAKFIDYEQGRRARLAEIIVNLVISTLLFGAEIFGIVKLVLVKYNILGTKLEILLVAGLIVVFTFVVVISTIIKLVKTINKQKQFRPVKTKKHKEVEVQVKPVTIKSEEKKDLIEPKFNIGKK